jgi:hypothetical protein
MANCSALNHRITTFFTAARIAIGACSLAILISGCVYLSRRPPPQFCASDDLHSPIRNLCVVAPGILWEGERPSAAQVRWLLEQGVGSIVSVQVDERPTFDKTSMPPELARSIPYFRITHFNAVRLLSRTDLDERVAEFLAIVRIAPKPIYVQCRTGVDRALVLAAAYRVLIQNMDPQQAINDVEGLHSPWSHAQAKYLRSLSPARKELILRRAQQLEASVGSSGEIRCLRGQCRFVPASGTLKSAGG